MSISPSFRESNLFRSPIRDLGLAIEETRLAPVIDRLEVEAPMLRVSRMGDGRYDIDDVLARLAAIPASPEPARFLPA